MPNIGHTTIEATGSPQDLAALAAHVRGTARGSSAFTLSALMHPDPAPDHAVCWAELSDTDEMISLSVGLRRDLDSLAVAARLAKRFPTLRIVASFVAECDEFAFDAVGFAKGELAYKAHFDDDIRFLVSARGPGGRCASLVRCFRRTPARSAAAPDHRDALDLGWLADRPVVAGEWRDITAVGLGSARVCWRPDAADGTGLALVARDGAFVLLTGMDCHGGYGRRKHLDAEGVVSRLPELADQVGRHLREHAADQMACKPLQACPGDLQDFDVPF